MSEHETSQASTAIGRVRLLGLGTSASVVHCVSSRAAHVRRRDVEREKAPCRLD